MFVTAKLSGTLHSSSAANKLKKTFLSIAPMNHLHFEGFELSHIRLSDMKFTTLMWKAARA